METGRGRVTGRDIGRAGRRPGPPPGDPTDPVRPVLDRPRVTATARRSCRSGRGAASDRQTVRSAGGGAGGVGGGVARMRAGHVRRQPPGRTVTSGPAGHGGSGSRQGDGWPRERRRRGLGPARGVGDRRARASHPRGPGIQSRPRPWRSSIMPSAAPSGPERGAEPGEHLLLAGEVSRVPPVAARTAPISCEIGQAALHQGDDLGVAGVDLAAQLTDPSAASVSVVPVAVAVRGVIGVSFGSWSAVGPRKRETPRGSSGPGRLLRLCSASGDGHRIPVTVEKADRGEHVGECATSPSTPRRPVGGSLAPDGAPGGAAVARAREVSPVRLTVNVVVRRGGADS